MKPAACPRAFEAEAVRDGRLAGAELASFARHAAACTACRRELQAFEALADALRAGAPEGTTRDELHILRERTRLIAAFDRSLVRSLAGSLAESLAGSLVAPTRRRRAFSRVLWPAAAAVIAGGFLFWRANVQPDVVTSPGVVVRADAAAVWARRSDARSDEVTLSRGELWIHVDHSRPHAKLVVALPDGWLEDVGTTFTVTVADRRTTRVAVQEGSVLLRIHGQPPVAIGGGQVWIPAPAAEGAPAALLPSVEPPPEPARRPSGPRLNHRERGRVHPGAERGAPMADAIESPDVANPAREFRAAVAALDGGAPRQAAAAFARFLGEHPRDARAEDAAYLRVIALERGGAADETRRAAQAYLQLFPNGFRRAEIEKLSR